MATITSTNGFSYANLHLGNLASSTVMSLSASDLFSFSLASADFLALQWNEGGQTYVTGVAGSDFSVFNDVLVSGTIEAAVEATLDTSTLTANLNWSILDIEVEVADLISAAITPSTDDDLALMADVFSGDDTFTLSGAVDDFSAGAGNDRVTAGGGNDTVYGGAGNDTIFGQANDDLLFGQEGADRLFGNLGNDTLFGGAQNDLLNGGFGDDILFGGGGKDFIKGAAGADRVIGGWGADTLIAEGADTFVYRSTAESGLGAKRRDVIRDFDADVAKIGLAQIDADTSTEANDAFAFAATNAANSVWFTQLGDNVILRADVDGNAKADIAILFEDAMVEDFDASCLFL